MYARRALARADKPPFAGPLAAALDATDAIRCQAQSFLPDYATELKGDDLPSLWSREPSG